MRNTVLLGTLAIAVILVILVILFFSRRNSREESPPIISETPISDTTAADVVASSASASTDTQSGSGTSTQSPVGLITSDMGAGSTDSAVTKETPVVGPIIEPDLSSQLVDTQKQQTETSVILPSPVITTPIKESDVSSQQTDMQKPIETSVTTIQTTIKDAEVDSSSGTPPVITVDTSIPPERTYIFYKGRYPVAATLQRDTGSDVSAMKTRCDRMPKCIGFTTSGAYFERFAPQTAWAPTPNPEAGFYAISDFQVELGSLTTEQQIAAQQTSEQQASVATQQQQETAVAQQQAETAQQSPISKFVSAIGAMFSSQQQPPPPPPIVLLPPPVIQPSPGTIFGTTQQQQQTTIPQMPVVSPSVRTFRFYANKDSKGSDIKQISAVTSLPVALRASLLRDKCKALPECAAFNTKGWLKRSVLPQSEWVELTGEGHGLYVLS